MHRCCKETFFVCHMSATTTDSGPRVKLVGCKSALNRPPPPPPPPTLTVVYSTDCSTAVILVLFLLFVALCSFVVPALRSAFSVCVVMLALWSPSSIAAHFAFCFTSCVVMQAFWSPSTDAQFAFCFTSCD